MLEQMIFILTCMLHVSVGSEKLQCQPKVVWLSSWREEGAFLGAIPLSSPLVELNKNRVIWKSMR